MQELQGLLGVKFTCMWISNKCLFCFSPIFGFVTQMIHLLTQGQLFPGSTCCLGPPGPGHDLAMT